MQAAAGVCFRCLQPTKTHLSHSDIVLGRQNYVPAFSTNDKLSTLAFCFHGVSCFLP